MQGRKTRALWVVLATVAAGGVLFAFGASAWRRSRCIVASSEPRDVLEAIRAAEEAYRAEHGTYLGCSSTRGAVSTPVPISRRDLHPRALEQLDGAPVAFAHDGDVGACFGRLGLVVSGPVRHSYAVHLRPGGAFEAFAVGAPDGPSSAVVVEKIGPSVSITSGDLRELTP